MLVGHLAAALAAKRAAARVNLGWLTAAAMWPDLMFPVFHILGIERARVVPGATAFVPLVADSYPWSHSLLMAFVWGFALAGVARLRKVPVATSLVVGLVVSHWGLDAVTHAPDMPLWPGTSPRVGLGLWNSLPATFVVEGALWSIGIAIFLRVNTGSPRAPLAFWGFVAVMTLVWASGPFAPPPPDEIFGWLGLFGWLIVGWSAIIDRRSGAGHA